MAKLPSVTSTPNDPDFDYEIPNIAAVYQAPESHETVAALRFGYAVYHILDLETLEAAIREVRNVDLAAQLQEALNLRTQAAFYEVHNADQTKLPM